MNQKRLSENFKLHSLGKLPFSGLKGLYNCYRRFNQLVASNEYDIIISTCELPDLLTALVHFTGIKIRTLQNSKAWAGTPRIGQFLEKRISSRRFKYNVAVSNSVKKAWPKYYNVPENKISVIPNGVDEAFYLANKNRSRISSSVLYIGIVGRLEKQKGHLFLLKAAKELKNKVSLKIHVIGIGSLEKELKEFVAANQLEDIIIFDGSLTKNELIRKYDSIDVLVMPSLYEGLPLAGIEAMAAGIPVIGSEAPGIVDCITHEQNGLLFKTADIEDLTKTIERIYHDQGLYKNLSREAGASAKIYSYPEIAGKYHELINSLLTNN